VARHTLQGCNKMGKIILGNIRNVHRLALLSNEITAIAAETHSSVVIIFIFVYRTDSFEVAGVVPQFQNGDTALV